MKRFLSIAAAVIFVATSARTADATALSIKLCNQYRAVTDFALAIPFKSSFQSVGWWRLATGKCATVSAKFPVNMVYLTYVFPAEQKGLVNAARRFAVNTNVDRNFVIQNAEKPHSGTSMFSFVSSPTYVGNSTFNITITMAKDGSSIQWGQ
jgi:uncharacterized membrane protein